MNYHNFASRLSLQRLPTPASTKVQPKATPKKSRRAQGRRSTSVAALVLLSALTFGADAGTLKDDARPSTPPAPPINLPTLLITLTGLGVVLLRLPTLWRRDFDC
ncbi:MAG: hypothetical protein ABJF10_12540 [Chthoniobacter sp.]|uniref:hypothetical protein n=1 Tax=Chthoniobacter sp. TaxID=2510640 RepID=UPI0032A9889F